MCNVGDGPLNPVSVRGSVTGISNWKNDLTTQSLLPFSSQVWNMWHFASPVHPHGMIYL